MSIKLKIKAKHLALEPKVIRHEENKLKKQIKYTNNAVGGTDKDKDRLIMELNSLVNHRKWDVRNESRATGLARAFLAGKLYLKCEQKRLDEVLFRSYIVPRVLDMVRKYKYSAKNLDILQKDITREVIMDWAKID